MRVPDWMVGGFFEPLWDRYEGSIRLQTMRKLAAGQFDSQDALAQRRSSRLNHIVCEAAAHSPFWRQRFQESGIDPAGVRSITDLSGLPLLTKVDVREHLSDILSARFSRESLVEAKTGGSTGTALQIFCDAKGVERRNGAALLTDTWSGWQLGQPVAAVWGNPPVPTTLKNKIRCTLKDRWIYLDTMKLNDEAVARFVEEWHVMKPGLLYGHAHSIFLFAETVRDMGVQLHPSGIIATSMMLLQPEREVIEAVFGQKVTDRYGCEEVSLIASECERHTGMHVNEEHCWVEILDDEGRECAPGVDGRLVITEFVNEGMPMLRYEVGDRGVWHDKPCSCGRPHRLLRGVTGRVADFLVARDGSRVAGISLIENTLTRYPGVAQLQVVQDARDHLILNLVPGDQWNDETREGMISVFQESLGGGFEVEIMELDSIPREPNGKYRFSICRVSREDDVS